MTNYFEIAFTPAILELQEHKGSREMFDAVVEGDHEQPIDLSPDEVDMITNRDSFYLASVSETGWPYLQHRGGPAGFVTQLNSHTIGWAERSGNRQYLGTGNIAATEKVAAIFVDYPSRTRLKLFGKATYHPEPSDDLVTALGADEMRNDGAITVEVVATNWNCPKYITPRYTEHQVQSYVAHLHQQIAELEAQVAASPQSG